MKNTSLKYTESELTGLVKFDAARQAIDIASSIDEIKDIRDKSEAMRAYAKQSHFSLKMQNQCCEIKIRAERKAGEILKESTRVGNPQWSHSATIGRLGDIGISKSQSSRWQSIASIPESLFEERLEDIKKRKEQELTSKDFLSLAGYLHRERKREERRESAYQEAKHIRMDDRVQVRHGDFKEVLKDIPDNSVDLMITDPIYAKENFSDWSDVSLYASRVLKQGKLLACYSSTNILAESIKRLSEHLTYVWTLAVIYPSCKQPHYRHRIHGLWKPVLLFSNGTYQPELIWIDDVIQGGGLIKKFHQWEQPVSESEYLIENLSMENDLVVDPYLGAGTSLVASRNLNRRFIGSDKDINCVNISRSRMGGFSD